MSDTTTAINRLDITSIHDSLAAGKTIITPTLRLARRVKAAWAELAEQAAIQTPSVYALEGWLEVRWRDGSDSGQLPPSKLLGRLEERLVWEQVIEQDLARSDDFSLLQLGKAAQQAMRSRQLLLEYGCDYRSSAVSMAFREDPDCSAFLRWVTAFDQRLANEGLATSADAQRALLKLSPVNRESVVLFHCIDVTPLASQVLAHLTVSVEDISGEVTGPAPLTQADAPKLVGRTFPDRRSELEAAARWAAQRWRVAAGTTAIVLLDMENDRSLCEYALRAEFDALDSRYNSLPVNFSKGISLAETPMYRDALGVLSLISVSISRQKLLELLRSPYLATQNLLTSEKGLLLVKRLFSLATDPISVSDLRHQATKLSLPLSEHLEAMRAMRLMSSKQDLWAWADSFKSILALWQWPARPAMDSLEHQQRERLDGVFDQFLSLSEVAGVVGHQQALQLFQRTLSESVFQPKTEDNAVQVLGLREALGLNFEAIWLCGMQSGALPRAAMLQPFIPPVLQQTFGLPEASSASVEHHAVKLLRSFAQTHGALYASWHRFEAAVEVLPSKLLAEQTPIFETAAINQRWLTDDLQRVSLEYISDTQAPPPTLEEGKASGGASLLKDQSQCPFRSWAAHRLRLRAMDDVAFGLTSFERGSLMHRALFTLWGEIEHLEKLRALSVDARASLVALAVDEALMRIEDHIRRRVGSACLDIERRYLSELLGRWLILESQRSADFSVIARESPVEVRVGPLRLNMRLDRIDQLDDGRHVVIDYKSGGALTLSAWLGERPMDPQLPIYALQDHNIAGIAWARVKHREEKFVALGDELGFKSEEQLTDQLRRYQGPAMDWPQLRESWRSSFENLAQEFCEGHAAIAPQKGACTYCDFASVCRFQQTQDSGLEAADDD